MNILTCAGSRYISIKGRGSGESLNGRAREALSSLRARAQFPFSLPLNSVCHAGFEYSRFFKEKSLHRYRQAIPYRDVTKGKRELIDLSMCRDVSKLVWMVRTIACHHKLQSSPNSVGEVLENKPCIAIFITFVYAFACGFPHPPVQCWICHEDS